MKNTQINLQKTQKFVIYGQQFLKIVNFFTKKVFHAKKKA